LTNAGVYFLIGNPENDSRPIVYVGEAEDCITRIKQHNADKNKDFWNIAVIVISKAKYFTKTHVKFLESHCHSEATTAGRYQIFNTTVPNTPHILEPLKMDLLDIFETIKTLVSTMGFPLFDSLHKAQKNDLLICRGKDAFAEALYTEDGMVVLKDSKSNIDETPTIGPTPKKLRQKLINDKVLVKDGNVYKFTVDYIFHSPSTAAATILGRSANGWTEWKYKNGKTLDEVKRQGG